MKKAILSSVLFLTLSFLVIDQLQAKTNIPEFIAKPNSAINIQPGNQYAIGKAYQIVDAQGKVVRKGIIRNNSSIYISSLELSAGEFNVKIENDVVQSFRVVKP